MNLKRIQYACEFLTEQMNHWMLFPIALTVMGMNRGLTGAQKPDVLLWLLCGLFPLGFFGLRIYCDKKKKFSLFLLLHVAAAAAMALTALALPLYTPSYMNKALCVLSPVLYMVYSMVLYVKRETLYSSAMQPLAAILLSLVASFFRQTEHWWNAYYSISLILSLMLFAVVFYMQHYMEFLSVNKNSVGHLPASEMFRSGMGLVLGYSLLGMGILVFSTQFEWLTGLLRFLWDLLLRFLRYVRSKLSGTPQEELTEMPVESLELPKVEGNFEPTETFWLWKVLEAVFLAAFIALLLYAAFKLLQLLLRMLDAYLKRQHARTSEEEVFDFRERCELEKTVQRRKMNLSFARTYREQIRRLYKRRLLTASTRRPDKSRLAFRTAREWERELHTEGMADVYEQARYSDREMTGADVKKMKEVCKL